MYIRFWNASPMKWKRLVSFPNNLFSMVAHSQLYISLGHADRKNNRKWLQLLPFWSVEQGRNVAQLCFDSTGKKLFFICRRMQNLHRSNPNSTGPWCCKVQRRRSGRRVRPCPLLWCILEDSFSGSPLWALSLFYWFLLFLLHIRHRLP